MNLKKEKEIYTQRTPRSAVMNQKAVQLMPGGISHEVRSFSPYPFLVKSCSGPYVIDIDGNQYIDYWMGHYIHILGHNPPEITDALQEQLNSGIMYGLIHESEIEVAEKICRIVPCAEQVKFCTTGTEATMYAVRLARGFTGKNRIFKMEGGWHGPNSELFHGVTKDFHRAETLGLYSDDTPHIDTLPFNDIEGCERILEKVSADEVAAIVVEPLIGSCWFIPAERDFLAYLRETCNRLDAVLIFDEIITGFRIALGGAQEHFGVTPDLTTLGKVLGAGMPLAAVVGKSDIMERANPHSGLPKWERVRIGGGTFSCHPMSMAAANSLLTYLEDNQGIYQELSRSGEQFRSDIANVFNSRNMPVAVTGLGSLFTVHFLKTMTKAPRNPHEALEFCDFQKKEIELKLLLLNEGMHVMHGGGALSRAHDEAVIEKTLHNFVRAADQLEAVGDRQ